MRSKLQWASGIAVAATMLTALFGAQGSGASAEELNPAITERAPPHFVSNPVVQPLPAAVAEDSTEPTETQDEAVASAATLAQLVETQLHPTEIGSEMHCLASAIYFEARGESLAGQLAVGRVIIERAKSGRFPASYCGVVLQRGQFSFVRGSRMPRVAQSSPAWRRAVAVAQIADKGSWDSPAEGALFFHATHVSPNWRRTRLARVDNHVFYR